MANIIEMPKLSDTMTAGTVVSWLKNEGDVVESGDILAEIETDKATQELETFDDGTILKIYVDVGGKAPCGAPLCAIGKRVKKPQRWKHPQRNPHSKVPMTRANLKKHPIHNRKPKPIHKPIPNQHRKVALHLPTYPHPLAIAYLPLPSHVRLLKKKGYL